MMKLTIMLGLAAGAVWAQDGKDIFLDKCAVCHGQDGAGKTIKGKKLNVKDVRTTAAKESAADMVKIVHDGKGTNMDGFAKDLSNEKIDAVVAYYRGLAK